MAQRKSMVELLAELTTDFPDQNTGQITPAILRSYFTKYINAIRPSYGILERTVGVAQALTTAFAPLVFTSGDISSGLGEFAVTPASGRIQRLDPGTTRLTLTADLVTASNQARTVSFQIYKNGVPTVWAQSITTNATGVVESISMPAIIYNDPGANYDMYVNSSVADTFTFSNMVWIAEVVPVNTY